MSTRRIRGPWIFTDVSVFTGTGNYTALPNEAGVYVKKASGAATTVTLPSVSGNDTRYYFVKDGKGDAATNNITVQPASGTIDGGSSHVISANYGSVVYANNPTTGEWSVVGTQQSSPNFTAINASASTLPITGQAGTGSGAGGTVSMAGGAGGATGAGGAVSVVGGAGGATSGTGGAASLTGGAGTNGNATGGAAAVTGGAGQGTGAGAVASITGGASGAGAPGNGGVGKVVGGAALSTNGSGGAAQVTGGVATGTGTGGAVTITSGASGGASGIAGNVTIDAGAATGGTAGIVTIGDTNSGGTFINRGALKSFFYGQTISGLGTVQSSTPTAAQLLGGVVTQTGATGAGTVTLPTGTAISAAMPRAAVAGDSFNTTFANLGGGFNLTITSATGATVVGNGAIPSGKNGSLEFVCTSANNFNVYVGVSG